jgi:predicted glycoside hydrolase/deacetylase ChbG (UPF0249 family)
MADSPGFSEAVQAAQASPTLGLGCHVVLVDGHPLSGSSRSTLVTPSGRFRASLSSFAVAALAGRIRPHDVESEAAAQIRKLQSAGLTLTHIDTHKHTHMFPAIAQPLLHAAVACGVRAVRNPFEPLRASFVLKRPSLAVRFMQVRSLHLFASSFRKTVAAAGMVTTDGTVGIAGTGALDLPMFAGLMASLPSGTWELVCHPGYDDSALANAGTRLRQSRVRELELLTSDAARRELTRAGIDLITYADLL